MKLNEYLTENGVKLMIKGSGENYPPRQTNDLGMYDYAEGLENVIGKMAWICDYRANADPTKKPLTRVQTFFKKSLYSFLTACATPIK